MTSATEHEYPQPQDGEIPRFSGLPTFFRLPFAPQTSELDISVVGVPWDGGTTNRAGTRHGRANCAMPPAWCGGSIR